MQGMRETDVDEHLQHRGNKCCLRVRLRLEMRSLLSIPRKRASSQVRLTLVLTWSFFCVAIRGLNPVEPFSGRARGPGADNARVPRTIAVALPRW